MTIENRAQCEKFLALPETAIIVLACEENVDFALSCVQRGAQDYLIKEAITPDLLTRAIRYAVERKKSESQLKSIARFPDENPNPVLRVDVNTYKVIYANNASRNLLAEWNISCGDVLPDFWAGQAKQCYETGKEDEYEIKCEDKILSLAFTFVADEEYINIYGSDISKRKSMEHSLREREMYFRAVVNSSEDGILAYDTALRVTVCNPAIEKRFEVSKDALIGKTPFVGAPIFEALGEIEAFRDACAGKKTQHWDKAYANGFDDAFVSSHFPLYDVHGNIIGGLSVFRDISMYKRAESRFRDLFAAAYDAIIVADADSGEIVEANAKAEHLLGIPLDELIGMSQLALHPSEKRAYYETMFRKASDEGARELEGIELLARDGTLIPVHASASVSIMNNRNVIIGIFHDLRDDRDFEEAFYNEKETAMVTLAAIYDAVITTDEFGSIRYLNPAAERLTGANKEAALGKDLHEIFRLVNELTLADLPNPVQKIITEKRRVKYHDHVVLINQNGVENYIELSASPIFDRTERLKGVVIVFQDISQSRKLFKQMSYHATHDHLTGLFNRKKLEEHLREIFVRAREENSTHALCVIDLDMFKVVNETCGHTAGDELLRQMGGFLRSFLGTQVFLARSGSDEFGIIFENKSIGEAMELAQEIRKEAYAMRFEWNGRVFVIRVSVGLVSISAQSESVSRLLNAVDEACYVAKEQGGNRVNVYTPEDTQLARRHAEMQWIARITRAFDENRFMLYRQTISPIDPRLSSDEYYEILIRMRGDDGKVIPPALFLPSAERYNLMPAIDHWVVKHTFAAYEKIKLLSEFNERNLRCSINLSGASLNEEGFLDFIIDQFVQYDVPTSMITFEITETVAIQNIKKATHFIASLKKRGCKFSLDDFGSGLSSFSYLKNLPVDFLKIDGSFIKDILDDPVNFAMVNSINHMGHILGMRTIAEFVENEAILEKLKEIGVDYAQGYVIAHPIPLEA